MKILDYSEYESLNYYQIKPGRDAGDEESIVYLPENYMPWFLNKKDLFPSKVIFNRYENGLYLGDKKNPYLALVGGEEGITELTIHKDTLYVIKEAFCSSELTKVTVLSERFIAGESAFSDSEKLKELYFQHSTHLHFYPSCFRKSSSLEKVEFNDECEFFFDEWCFRECKNLSEISLPKKGGGAIGEEAFIKCGLKKVYLPKTITRIVRSFDKEVEIYYEGDCKDLIVAGEYETAGDYSFNFHRSSGGWDSHGESATASGGRFHSFVTPEEWEKVR